MLELAMWAAGGGSAMVAVMHVLKAAPLGSKRNALYVLLGGGGPGLPK